LEYRSCGGGLSTTKSLIYHLRKHQDKGYCVNIVAKVDDSELLNAFEYMDSHVYFDDILKKSEDLIHYRVEVFSGIYDQFQEIKMEYGMA